MSALLAAAYFPPARYMAHAVRAGEIFLEGYETYPKQTCRNHCVIYGPNGEQTLTVPVHRINGNRTLTRDVSISDHVPWQRIHWRALETAYSNSPYFLFYMDHVRPFFEKKFTFLIDLDQQILQTMLGIMGLRPEISVTGRFVKASPGEPSLLTDLTAKHDSRSGQYPHYTQVFEPAHGFIAGLSILDVLFNLGPETRDYLSKLS